MDGCCPCGGRTRKALHCPLPAPDLSSSLSVSACLAAADCWRAHPKRCSPPHLLSHTPHISLSYIAFYATATPTNNTNNTSNSNGAKPNGNQTTQLVTNHTVWCSHRSTSTKTTTKSPRGAEAWNYESSRAQWWY